MKNRAKANYKLIFASVVGFLLLIGIIAQIIFNLYIWQSINLQTIFTMRTLFSDGLTSLQAQQQIPVDRQKIPETNLVLPKETNDVKNIRYIYHEQIDDSPEYIQITTTELMQAGIAKLNGKNVKEIIDNIPEAQACFSGFRIYINKQVTSNTEEETKLISTKKLADGREIYIVRELGCGKDTKTGNDDIRTFIMNNLEKYLLKIESY